MAKVSKLLEEHRDILTRMSEELLEKETIVLTDIERIVEDFRPGQYTTRIAKAKQERLLAAHKGVKPAAPAAETVQPEEPVEKPAAAEDPGPTKTDDPSEGAGQV
jgi:cell division protease FtsH